MSTDSLPTNCVELLQAMVRHDTVTPRTSGRADSEAPLGRWLAALARNWRLEPRMLEVPGAAPNLLLTHRVDPALPWLLLDSHLDTVGVEQMTIDPFAGEVRDNRLYARGACDTKGTGAAMLWAMKDVVAEGVARNNLALLFTVGEEARQVGARAFLESDLPGLGWRPSLVVVGEPTKMNVVRAANGYVRFNLVTHGKAAHSSAPAQGHNAISDMARAITLIEDQYIAHLDGAHPLVGRATCSINVVRGGSEHNVVPQKCVATVDHRLTPGQDAEGALAQIRQTLAPLAATRPGFRYELADVESAPPLAPDDNQPASEWVHATLRRAELEPQLLGAPYTTNANHFAGHGLQAVVLGPGDIAQAHTPDEWICLDQLAVGVRGYRALMTHPAP